MKLTILLVTAVCFWSGLFYFASCSDHPEKRAVEIAERALKATVDNPESIQIKGISKADSVFGKEYVNPHEKAALSMHLMQYGHKLMEETDYFQNIDKDDIAMSDQVTRQLDDHSPGFDSLWRNERNESRERKGCKAVQRMEGQDRF